MKTTHGRLAVAISGRIYQGVIWLFPPAFRRAFGTRMTRLFHEQCRDAFRDRGIPGLARVWLHGMIDIGGVLLLEWENTLSAAWKESWQYHLLMLLGVFAGRVAMHTGCLPALPLLLFACAGMFGALSRNGAWEGALRLSTGVALVRLIDAVIGPALPCPTYLLAIGLAAGATLLGAASGAGLSAGIRRWHAGSLTAW